MSRKSFEHQFRDVCLTIYWNHFGDSKPSMTTFAESQPSWKLIRATGWCFWLKALTFWTRHRVGCWCMFFSFFFWANINQHVINITYLTQLSSLIMIDVSGYRILIQFNLYCMLRQLELLHQNILNILNCNIFLLFFFWSRVVKCPDMIHDDIHVYVNIKCFFPGIEMCGRPSIWWFQLSWKIIQ